MNDPKHFRGLGVFWVVIFEEKNWELLIFCIIDIETVLIPVLQKITLQLDQWFLTFFVLRHPW